MIIMGGLTAVAFFIFILKLPTLVRRRLLGFDLLVDIAATVSMMLAFSGTFAGMAAAVVGGLIFSALLIITKFVSGYEKGMIYRSKGNRVKIMWVLVPGIFNNRRQPTWRHL